MTSCYVSVLCYFTGLSILTLQINLGIRQGCLKVWRGPCEHRIVTCHHCSTTTGVRPRQNGERKLERSKNFFISAKSAIKSLPRREPNLSIYTKRAQCLGCYRRLLTFRTFRECHGGGYLKCVPTQMCGNVRTSLRVWQ